MNSLTNFLANFGLNFTKNFTEGILKLVAWGYRTKGGFGMKVFVYNSEATERMLVVPVYQGTIWEMPDGEVYELVQTVEMTPENQQSIMFSRDDFGTCESGCISNLA